MGNWEALLWAYNENNILCMDAREDLVWQLRKKRGPLSLVKIIEELLERKCSGSGQENQINGRGIRFADYATTSIRKSWH
jgi:hypothetical protein